MFLIDKLIFTMHQIQYAYAPWVLSQQTIRISSSYSKHNQALFNAAIVHVIYINRHIFMKKKRTERKRGRGIRNVSKIRLVKEKKLSSEPYLWKLVRCLFHKFLRHPCHDIPFMFFRAGVEWSVLGVKA
jgi:hypothetical protein